MQAVQSGQSVKLLPLASGVQISPCPPNHKGAYMKNTTTKTLGNYLNGFPESMSGLDRNRLFDLIIEACNSDDNIYECIETIKRYLTEKNVSKETIEILICEIEFGYELLKYKQTAH